MKTRKVAAFAALVLFTGAVATAQNKPQLAKITAYEVKKEYQSAFQNAVSNYVLNALSDQDNIMAEAYFEKENQNRIWLFERWTNEKAFQEFQKNSTGKALKTTAKTALKNPERIINLKDLEPISKRQWRRTSRKEDDQLTIMLFVDAKQGTQENFKMVYHKAMPEFRSEAGVVTYQLSQFNDDQTQFVTFEKFRSKEAFEHHLNFPPIQPVLDYLNSNIKKQPFQNGIHNLIEFAPLFRE